MHRSFVVFCLLLFTMRLSNAAAVDQILTHNATDASATNEVASKIFELPLVPIPHMLCTGMNIVGILEACFPVGCICAKGAGICDIKNRCIRVSTPQPAYQGWKSDAN